MLTILNGGKGDASVYPDANVSNKASTVIDNQDNSYAATYVASAASRSSVFESVLLTNGQPIIAIVSFEIPKNISSLKSLSIITRHNNDRKNAYFTNVKVF